VSGRLELVATPIGNLGDLAPRAIEVLRDADRILCEDTRRTRSLLSASEVPARGRLEAFHEHNEALKIPRVLERLRAGELVAVVCDAGTPGISDPGSRLVAAAVASGLDVGSVPGPSAILAALVVSGLPTDRFVMEGFLPRRGSERQRRLTALRAERRTVVLFESPRRVGATLAELAATLDGGRALVVARELTKLHEEIWRGTLEEGAGHFVDHELRGEVVLVMGGSLEPEREATEDDIVAALAAARADGRSTRDAAAEVAEALGVPRRRVYDLAIGAGGPKR
jgi:16S rRNA (cytidine1402-2'-O)-methyltransferase